MKPFQLLLWIIPIALLVNTACGDNCKNLTPTRIISGSYVTRTASDLSTAALHATGTDKHMLLDREGSELTLTYESADGSAIVETWAIGEYQDP